MTELLPPSPADTLTYSHGDDEKKPELISIHVHPGDRYSNHSAAIQVRFVACQEEFSKSAKEAIELHLKNFGRRYSPIRSEAGTFIILVPDTEKARALARIIGDVLEPLDCHDITSQTRLNNKPSRVGYSI